MKKKTKTTAPFPFLGQGDAEYYEWFEMWIWFEKPVPPKERKALLRGAPRLCVLDAQWPNATLLWASTGDQWIPAAPRRGVRNERGEEAHGQGDEEEARGRRDG